MQVVGELVADDADVADGAAVHSKQLDGIVADAGEAAALNEVIAAVDVDGVRSHLVGGIGVVLIEGGVGNVGAIIDEGAVAAPVADTAAQGGWCH